MPYQTITMSSAAVPGVSSPEPLSWRGGKPASVWVTPNSSTTTGTFSIQYTLDDLQLTPGTGGLWASVSSAAGQPGTVFNASTCGLDGVLWSFLSPVAAVRITSTALSSGPWTMKIMQGEGW